MVWPAVAVLIGCAVIALPGTISAQQNDTPIIGFLSSASPDSFAHLVEAFRQGLRQPAALGLEFPASVLVRADYVVE